MSSENGAERREAPVRDVEKIDKSRTRKSKKVTRRRALKGFTVAALLGGAGYFALNDDSIPVPRALRVGPLSLYVEEAPTDSEIETMNPESPLYEDLKNSQKSRNDGGSSSVGNESDEANGNIRRNVPVESRGFIVPKVGISVPYVFIDTYFKRSVEAINPPTLEEAYVLRSWGMPGSTTDTVVAALHSVRKYPDIPGSKLVNFSTMEPSLIAGDEIFVDGFKYIVHSSFQQSKSTVARDSSLWEHRAGRLLVVTCVPPRKREKTRSNIIIEAFLEGFAPEDPARVENFQQKES